MLDEEENEELKKIAESTNTDFNHVVSVYKSLKLKKLRLKSRKEILKATEIVIKLSAIPNINSMTHDDIKKQIENIKRENNSYSKP